MLCILYVIAVGTVLAWVGLLIERALPATASRRWVWCGVIVLSVFIPGLFRSHHSATLSEFLTTYAAWVPGGPSSSDLVQQGPDIRWSARLDGPDRVIESLWQAVSVLLLVWGFLSAARVSRLVRAQRRAQQGQLGPRVVDGVPVLVTESLGPATTGVWRSRVLVPRWVLALPAAQRRYVLQHEDEHRKAWDGRMLFLASLTVVLLPWNLALWWQLRRLSLAVETDCDRRVVNALGDARRYGTLLLDVARASSGTPRLQPALLGSAGTLEHRLTQLVAPKTLDGINRFLAPAIAVALLLLVLSVPHPVLRQEAEAHAHSMTPPASSQR
jgi:beta-lactamase regulating signal transducer with metallopeptidase domain